MASNVSVVIKSVGAKETASDIKSIGDAADKAGDSAEHSGSKLASAFGGIAKLAIGAGVGLGALGGIVGAVGFRFDNMKEQATIAFTTMLGDGTKAKAFLDDLQDFAAKTPFEFPELIQASQKLLAMGFAAKDVRPMLTAVGDAVAGLGGGSEMIDRVTTALGQMHAKGKTSSEEMMQLTEAGIPAWQMLADAIGTSVPEAMDKVQHGAIDADTTIAAVTKGMETRFGGMMDKQSHTFGGLLSTIKDTFTQVSGQVMAPFFDMATRGLQKIVDLTSTKGFQNGVQAFADGLASAASAAADFIASGIEKIGPTLVDIASLTFDGLMELYRLEWEGMQKAWEVIGPILTDAASLAWDKLLDLANASWDKLQALGPTFDSLKTSMAGIDSGSFASGWERVKNALQPAVDVLRPLAEQLLASIANQFKEIGAALGPFFESLKPLEPLLKPIAEILGTALVAAIAALLVQLRLFTDFTTAVLVTAINGATLAIRGITKTVAETAELLGPLVGTFKEKALAIVGGIANAFTEGWTTVRDAVWKMKDLVVGGLGNVKDWLVDVGWDLLRGIAAGIMSGAESIVKSAIDFVAGKLPAWARHALGISSPSKVMAEQVGEPIAQGIAAGIESGAGSVAKAVANLAAEAASAAVPAINGIVAGIGRGTPEQVAAIYKGIANGTIQDWAADYSRGYLGAATYMNGPSGSMQQQPSTVPGYVTAWARNTASMPTPASQITVHIEALDAASFEDFARRNRVQFAGTIVSALQANGLAMS